jgi:ATP-dependent Clp protease, protease subunit
MSLKALPKINAKAPIGVKFDVPSDSVARWDAAIISASSDSSTITMYDNIGSDGWTEGVTTKRVSAALRSIGAKDVVVSINSPGGDFFEGIAIYNLLREHPHKITVKVVGLAASSASIIAMAGDEIQIAKSGFLMVHNAWAVVIGNRHDLVDASVVMAEFDTAMAQLYADAAGITTKAAAKLMDAETWMSGQAAIDAGFATSLLPEDEILTDGGGNHCSNAALKKVESILSQQGLPRAERRELLRQITGGMPGAAPNVTPGADELMNEIKSSTTILKGILK